MQTDDTDALPLDPRRRKLRFRSWHRGMREVDLILGPFADARIASLTAEELDQYEELLDRPDTILLPYLLGQVPVSELNDQTMLRAVIAFRPTALPDR